MDAALLDTDILNEVLKQQNVQVLQHASAYLGQHGQFAVSSITRYEVVRGLRSRTHPGRWFNIQGDSTAAPISFFRS